MANMKVIDVSHYQGSINWTKVKAAGIEGVIIKAGGCDYGRDYTDSKYEEYYKGATAAGLHVGAYYYTSKNFFTEAQAKTEAACFIKKLQGKKFDLPVYADIEAVAAAKGKQFITDAAIIFCKELEAAGYFVGIYASEVSGFKERLDPDQLTAYTLWVAKYSSKKPSLSCGMWQYTSGGKVDGISGNVDMDTCYRDFPSIIGGTGRQTWTINTDPMTSGDVTAVKNLLDSLKIGYTVTATC